MYEWKVIEIFLFPFVESVQEQLGEAEGEGLWAAFGLALHSHRQSQKRPRQWRESFYEQH